MVDCGLRIADWPSGAEHRDGVASGIFFVEVNGDFFRGAGGEGEAGVVGGDGHEAATTIHEDSEFDFGGAAVVEEFVEGGFDSAAGEEDVVGEDHDLAVHVGGDVRRGKFLRDRLAADVVAMEGNIYRAGARAEAGGKTAGKLDAAVGDAEEEEAAGVAVARGDGGGQARDRGFDVGGADGFWRGHGEG